MAADETSNEALGELPRAYLERTGWLRSRAEKLPVDAKGQPLPWYTYPMIAFLRERVKRRFHVLEFGAGNSTLWWAARVTRVRSIEHTAGWAQKLAPMLPANASVVHVPLEPDGAYCRSGGDAPIYDIVAIDGRDRVNCVRQCLAALKPDGVIVWDNSERPRYEPGYEHLATNGFRRIDFAGLGPINDHGWRTSVFYRPDNCLGL